MIVHAQCLQVKEGTELKLEDEVSFCAGLNAATGAYKALSVSLEMTANERENKQELGQVCISSTLCCACVCKPQDALSDAVNTLLDMLEQDMCLCTAARIFFAASHALTSVHGKPDFCCCVQIKSMKKEFGFINCCERVADMFFHHSALSGAPEAFAVGADVSFKVAKEPKGDRLNAVE